MTHKTSPQLATTQEHLYDLEKKLETPENKGRVRLLKGQDPDPDKLEEDCEKLEERLAEQEQKLLEKELILEEETRLTDRVSKKVKFRPGLLCLQLSSLFFMNLS